jgi:hypothetical protein
MVKGSRSIWPAEELVSAAMAVGETQITERCGDGEQRGWTLDGVEEADQLFLQGIKRRWSECGELGRLGSARLCYACGWEGEAEGMKEKRKKTDMWVLSNVACHGGETTGQNHLRACQG